MEKTKSFTASSITLMLSVVLGLVIFFIGCSDDKDSQTSYDPNKPLEFISYIPADGGVGTKLVITGSNFGSDTSLIKVYVNDKLAPIIGMNNEHIYAVVSPKTGSGFVRIEAGTGDNKKVSTSDKEFLYEFRENVSTLCGKTDANGMGGVTDGTLDEAWITYPVWMALDNEGDLYTIEWDLGARIISQQRNEVTTPMRVSGDVKRVRTIEFTYSKDTLMISNEQGNSSGTAVVSMTRNNGFMNPRTFIKSKYCSAALSNPVDGQILYCDGSVGTVYRWDPVQKKGIELLTMGKDIDPTMCFSKDGKTLFIGYKHHHYIGKADYDFVTKSLSEPQPFIGQKGVAGNKEGIGAEALINTPTQMTIEDDGTMYVCDSQNHCIRKITPAGVMTTYAGTPGQAGLLDGLPSKAMFRSPEGIVIDKDGVVYVADTHNHRIRKILVE